MHKEFLAAEAIKKLLEEYFAAVYQADIPKLKEIFHPQAAMYGYLGADLLAGTPEPFLADLGSKPSMAANKDDCRYVIKNLAVTGEIAEATLLVDGFYGAACIEDHFHLICTKGRWQIVCKTFTTID